MTADAGSGGQSDPSGAAGYLSRFSFWWFVCLLAAAIHAWAHAHAMNPDGLVYIDMASAALRDGPTGLVNGLWSPGYPALIAVAMALVRPGPALEFPLAHGVNFLVFCFTLLGFSYFLKSWQAAGEVDRKPWARWETPLGFAVFLWFTLGWIGLQPVSPDLLMAGAVFFAAGRCCRIGAGAPGWRPYAWLGAVLGAGFYAKAPLLPLGALLLALLFVWQPPRFSRRGVIIAAGVFAMVSAPLIAMLSGQAGRFSVGESGRLNYAWHVNGLPQFVWTGGGGNQLGRPVHPPRKILDDPLVIEFATPVKGTYPLWYDPAYWYAGATPRFTPGGQLRALKAGAASYWWSLQLQTILIGGLLALAVLGGLERTSPPGDRIGAVLLVWAAAACGLFALVHVEFRYVAVFLVPAWLAIYRRFGQDLEAGVRRAVLLCVALVLTTQVAMDLPGLVAAAWARSSGAAEPEYTRIATGLSAAGVNPGDKLATVDLALDAYYARFIGSRVVAHVMIPDATSAASADWRKVKKSLAGIGVKALVARQRPAGAAPGDWLDLPSTGPGRYSVMMVPSGGDLR